MIWSVPPSFDRRSGAAIQRDGHAAPAPLLDLCPARRNLRWHRARFRNAPDLQGIGMRGNLVSQSRENPPQRRLGRNVFAQSIGGIEKDQAEPAARWWGNGCKLGRGGNNRADLIDSKCLKIFRKARE